MNATLTSLPARKAGRKYYLAYAVNGISANPEVKLSTLPDRLDRPPKVNIVGLTVFGVIRLSPQMLGVTAEHLARILAHEWYHAWQAVRWAKQVTSPLLRWARKLAFPLMYVPRLILRGHTAKPAGAKGKENEIEGNAYRWADANWQTFLPAATLLLDLWHAKAAAKADAHLADAA